MLSKILQGEKQKILKKDFECLITELVNKNYCIMKSSDNNSDLKDVKKESGNGGKLSYLDNTSKIVMNGGQIIAASENVATNVTQSNGVNVYELDNIIKEIMFNLLTFKRKDADNITDVVEMARDELTKPEPRVSRLRHCLNLFPSLFTIANGIPSLMENLMRLQGFISMYIR